MPRRFHAIPDRNGLNFSWLMKLRWSSIAGQIGTILGVYWIVDVKVPLLPLFAIIGIEFASNVGCAVWFASKPRVAEWHLAAVMALDIALLTGLLYFSGGPFNPFSFLYLVNIALAAVVLHAQWTWMLVGLALLSFGLLGLLDYEELPIDHLSPHERAELLQQGVWVAFGVAAAFIVHFLWRVTGALWQREQELTEARAQAARQERLASLATMAAGAAHELSTPLGTIALVAKELEHGKDKENGHGDDRLLEDVRLIREQAGRCRVILDQMAGGIGKSEEQAFESISVDELLAEAQVGIREGPEVRVEAAPEVRAAELRVPPRAAAQALRSLLTNAQDASPADEPVRLVARLRGGALSVSVSDRGPGMRSEVLARVGEPFYTTKEPGRGMGLGLFLTRAVVEKLGGDVAIDSRPGEGTRVRVTIPRGTSRRELGTDAARAVDTHRG